MNQNNHYLLTGTTGFLGSIINHILIAKGFKVTALTQFKQRIDITTPFNLDKNLNPDVVVHIAGKAHSVPRTQVEENIFYDINFNGTKNLCLALENLAIKPKFFIFISSVAVYGKEKGILINENAPLLAKDPYGLSKIKAEKFVQNWCEKHNVICTILRLPLIAGPNPKGNLQAMIRAISKNYYFNIGGGHARKSIVLAEDVAVFIPQIIEIGGIYNLTDGYHPSFSELSEIISKQLHKCKPANIPFWLAKIMARIGDLFGTKAPLNSDKLKKIICDLTFDNSKACKAIGWKPTPVLQGLKIQ